MTATIARPAKGKLPHIEQLAAKLADARVQRKMWEIREAALVDQLVAAHAAGVALTKFTSQGWSFTFQEGRTTIVYPEPVVAAVKALQAQAVEAGITTARIGKPFWKVLPAKEEG
jgi:hypothetical protein